MQHMNESNKLARNSDPVTSHLAAKRVNEFMGSHQEIIWVALASYGPMTVDQIAAQAGLQSQAVNKRLPEMQRLGLAVLVEGEIRPSASGRMSRVWSAA